ncbi:MAG: DUF4423 domain-containing protein [Candidatus Asgardarchaeia archaeon]
MNSRKENYFTFFDTLDEFLSRQELQKILSYLATFDEADIDTLKNKLNLPLEVIVKIISTLLELNIIEQTSKGNFRLASSQLGKSVRTFYKGTLEKFVNKKINEIMEDSKNVKSFAELENILKRIDLLLRLYRPIIDEKFGKELKLINMKINDLKKKLKS